MPGYFPASRSHLVFILQVPAMHGVPLGNYHPCCVQLVATWS